MSKNQDKAAEAMHDEINDAKNNDAELAAELTPEQEAQPVEENAVASAVEAALAEEALRHAAAIQNLQRRHRMELEDAHKFAAQSFAREMLPVKDYLEMALQDASGDFNTLKIGVEMTLKTLVNAFDNAKIKEINPVGEKLDPAYHSAMSTEANGEVEPNTVLRVMQKGYTLNDRILRPAMVVVSAVPDEETPTPTTEA